MSLMQDYSSSVAKMTTNRPGRLNLVLVEFDEAVLQERSNII